MWVWAVLLISLLSGLIAVAPIQGFLADRNPYFTRSRIDRIRVWAIVLIFLAGVLAWWNRVDAEKRLRLELRQVKEMATSHDFHPISSEQFQRLRGELSSIYEQQKTLNPRVIVWFEHSVPGGAQIAEQLSELFKSADIPAEVKSAMRVGERHAALEIYCNQQTEIFARDVLKRLSLVLRGNEPKIYTSANPTGEMAIEIHAAPTFSLDGGMTF